MPKIKLIWYLTNMFLFKILAFDSLLKRQKKIHFVKQLNSDSQETVNTVSGIEVKENWSFLCR